MKLMGTTHKLLLLFLTLLIFTVSFLPSPFHVFAQEAVVEEEPEYFMGILILESQQQMILDSIRKIKDLGLGNMVILHPMDQEWNLNLIEEAVKEANNLGLYIVFETYNASDHYVRVTPHQFGIWKEKYPRLLGILVQEITGKQIDYNIWANNSTGAIKTRLGAEQAVIENITAQMQLAEFKSNGAKILLQENVISYASANTSYCDVLISKVFNAPNTELMIGLTRGMTNTYDIPVWGLWVDTWKEWTKPPAFTPNDVKRALYEGWFYGAKYFFFEQGCFFGTLDRDWPEKYIILGQDGKLTEYGKVIQKFYTFLQNQKNIDYDQPDYRSPIAVMIGQSGWSSRGSDWGFWPQSDRQGDFDYRLLNLFFPGIGNNWQIGTALTGKEFTGLPLGMVDIISIYAPPAVLKQYKVIVALGWSQMNNQIADNIEEYVEEGGIFLSLLTFTHSNKVIDNLESPVAWLQEFDSLFGIHVATLSENELDIKVDTQLHNVTFTQDTYWHQWNGTIYNYVSDNRSGSWFWKFKTELDSSENTTVIAWVNGIQKNSNVFIVENKKGSGYTYVVNTRNPNSLPDGVLTDVLIDFVYFLCSYYVNPMTDVPYPEVEYWLCQGQSDRVVYLMHDNSTATQTVQYPIIQSDFELNPDKNYIIYDYINNEYYGITDNSISSLKATMESNQAKLFIFLEMEKTPQLLASEAILTEAPLFTDQHLTLGLNGVEEATNITKIYCGDLEQPRYIFGTPFNLTQNFYQNTKILSITSNSDVTFGWDNIHDSSVIASTVSLTEFSWNESLGTLNVSVNGTAGQNGSIQLYTGGKMPYYVKVNGEETHTWSYNSSTTVISVTFPSDATRLVFGFKPMEIDETFVSDKRADVGSIQTVGFHLSWMGNGSDIEGATVNVNGTEYVTNETGWVSFNSSYDKVGRVVWVVKNVEYEGLTDYASSASDPFIIWDKIAITDSILLDRIIQVDSSQSIWLTAEYEYDSSIFDGSMGTMFLNGEPMRWSSQNSRWEQTITSSSLGLQTYEATRVNDEIFGITKIQKQTQKLEITWDKIEISTAEFETTSLGETNVKIYVTYNYSNAPIVNAEISVNGKTCNKIEDGKYECKIYGWNPIQTFYLEGNSPDFTQVKITISKIHISNTILYITIGLAITLIAFFTLRNKRRKTKT